MGCVTRRIVEITTLNTVTSFLYVPKKMRAMSKTGFKAECATFYKYWIDHYPVCICLAVSKYGNLSCNEAMGTCIFSTIRVHLKNFSTKQKLEHVH